MHLPELPTLPRLPSALVGLAGETPWRFEEGLRDEMDRVAKLYRIAARVASEDGGPEGPS
ncbi:MAG: hypothetical protein ACT4PT_07545 [Methanobacteriota archaeon]